MRFDCTDFEDMREWILTLPAPHPAMQEWRIDIFDKLRYAEEYEEIYELIKGLGGEII